MATLSSLLMNSSFSSIIDIINNSHVRFTESPPPFTICPCFGDPPGLIDTAGYLPPVSLETFGLQGRLPGEVNCI